MTRKEKLLAFGRENVNNARRTAQEGLLLGELTLEGKTVLNAKRLHNKTGEYFNEKAITISNGELVNFNTNIEDIILRYLKTCLPEYFDENGDFLDEDIAPRDSILEAMRELEDDGPTRH